MNPAHPSARALTASAPDSTSPASHPAAVPPGAPSPIPKPNPPKPEYRENQSLLSRLYIPASVKEHSPPTPQSLSCQSAVLLPASNSRHLPPTSEISPPCPFSNASQYIAC